MASAGDEKQAKTGAPVARRTATHGPLRDTDPQGAIVFSNEKPDLRPNRSMGRTSASEFGAGMSLQRRRSD